MVGVHIHPPELFSEEYQAEMLVRQYQIIKGKSYTIGANIWALAEEKRGAEAPRLKIPLCRLQNPFVSL